MVFKKIHFKFLWRLVLLFNSRLCLFHLLPVGRHFPDGRRWSWVFGSYKNVQEIPEHCRWHRRPSPPRACWKTESDCRCQSPSPRDGRQRWVNTQIKRTLKIKRGKEKKRGENPSNILIDLSFFSENIHHFHRSNRLPLFRGFPTPLASLSVQTEWAKKRAACLLPFPEAKLGVGGKIRFAKWRNTNSFLRFLNISRGWNAQQRHKDEFYVSTFFFRSDLCA